MKFKYIHGENSPNALKVPDHLRKYVNGTVHMTGTCGSCGTANWHNQSASGVFGETITANGTATCGKCGANVYIRGTTVLK